MTHQFDKSCLPSRHVSVGSERAPHLLTLYHCANTRSFRPLWTLEELGLAYELIMLPFPPRVQQRSYLDINPLGTVPYLVDGDAALTESTAACHYLATRHGDGRLLIGPDEPDYPAWLNALYYADATLTFPQALFLRYSRLEPQERRQPQVAEDYRRWFLARLSWLERRLDKAIYVAGSRFTIADIAVGYALMLADILGLATDFRPPLAAYLERLKARDGFRSAVVAQEAAGREQGVPANL